MATITITTPGGEVDQRLVAAFRDRLGPEAGVAEVKAWLIDQIKAVVHSYETRLAAEQAVAGIVPVEPT